MKINGAIWRVYEVPNTGGKVTLFAELATKGIQMKIPR